MHSIKYYLVSIFTILFLFIANPTVFANNYEQQHHIDILETGNYIENANLFGFENGQNNIESWASLKCSFRQENEKVMVVVGKAAKQSKTIFRAVDNIELGLLKSQKRFILQPGGTEVKYFAKTLDDANWYGKMLYPKGYSIVKGQYTGSLSKYWYPNIDIGAYAIPKTPQLGRICNASAS